MEVRAADGGGCGELSGLLGLNWAGDLVAGLWWIGLVGSWLWLCASPLWIPAFAGMTDGGGYDGWWWARRMVVGATAGGGRDGWRGLRRLVGV